MSNAGLWSRKGWRTRGPLEALDLSTTISQPPHGTDTAEGRGMERHHYKCEFQLIHDIIDN